MPSLNFELENGLQPGHEKQQKEAEYMRDVLMLMTESVPTSVYRSVC